ncbi:MAG: DNA double-strand break repair nuclease NurA [Candidatus Micrarchaeia archaeon]
MINGFEGAFEKAGQMQRGIAKAAAMLKSNAQKINVPGSSEQGLVKKIRKAALETTVAAVDGGMLSYSFRYMDITAVRAAGVVFAYSGSRLDSHQYVPSKNPPFESFAWSGLEYGEAAGAASLARLDCEIALAARIAREKKPGMLLIDGSLVPLVSDKPAKDSQLKPEYESLVKNYSGLFSECEKNGTMLVGFSKDSRGRRFSQALEKTAELEALERASDLAVMSRALDGGERSVSLPYAQEKKSSSILEDFGEWGGRLMLFYMKPSGTAQAYRIEFLKTAQAGEDAVASACLELCMFGKRYQYPPPLIEADMVASAKPRDARIFEAEIARIGADRKIRDDRPFR